MVLANYIFLKQRLGKEIMATNTIKMQSLLKIYRNQEDGKYCKHNLNPTMKYPFHSENLK